jgi:hypothetical protein
MHSCSEPNKFGDVLIHLLEKARYEINFISYATEYESKSVASRFLHLLVEDLSELTETAKSYENKDMVGLIQTFAQLVYYTNEGWD